MSNPKGWDEVDGIKLPPITWGSPVSRIKLTRVTTPCPSYVVVEWHVGTKEYNIDKDGIIYYRTPSGWARTGKVVDWKPHYNAKDYPL